MRRPKKQYTDLAAVRHMSIIVHHATAYSPRSAASIPGIIYQPTGNDRFRWVAVTAGRRSIRAGGSRPKLATRTRAAETRMGPVFGDIALSVGIVPGERGFVGVA